MVERPHFFAIDWELEEFLAVKIKCENDEE